MANVKAAYGGATATTITCTQTSLANTTGARASTAIDNQTNLFLDVLVFCKTNGSAAGNTSVVTYYAYAAVDGTTPVYSDGATGTDAAITVPTNGWNSKPLGYAILNGTTSVTSGPFSVAAAFGGYVPPKWGVIAVNTSGAALSSTAGDHVITYVGVYATVV